MKNIYLIPTDKPSRVYSKDGNYKLDTITIAMDWYISEGYKPQNINITNNEDIKEGDWCIVTPFGADKFAKVVRFKKENGTLYNLECKKIILTTDADLIKDGVQAIDDEFLEWFVNNPSCEKVELKYKDHWDSAFAYYEIIIPKEATQI